MKGVFNENYSILEKRNVEKFRRKFVGVFCRLDNGSNLKVFSHVYKDRRMLDSKKEGIRIVHMASLTQDRVHRSRCPILILDHD